MKNEVLDALISWAVKCGHYTVPPLVENFKRYEESMKDRETEALRERVEKE